MSLVSTPLASIPSPSVSVWHLGPVPIRAYALCIVAGIVVATVVADRRMRARGGQPWLILDIAVWAVPFGIIGARIYHVITSPDKYFGAEGHLINVVKIWEGGLGIWGAVAGGALGVWIACRQLRVPFSVVADSLAVGLPLAQAVGRFGNWFNNELYGKRADDLPWGLQVHYMGPDGRATDTVEGLYHPTFLYEALWDVGVAGLVWWLDRKFKFGRGRAFALYVMAYTAGRAWIEMLRIDDEKTVIMFLGQRLNVWTSVVVFLAAAIYFFAVRGPRQYMLPADPDTGGAPYRAVTEAEFRAAGEGTAGNDSGAATDDDDGADAQGDGTEPPTARAGTPETSAGPEAADGAAGSGDRDRG